jgi:hypothetical protein
VGTLIIPNFYKFWQTIQEKYLERKKDWCVRYA